MQATNFNNKAFAAKQAFDAAAKIAAAKAKEAERQKYIVGMEELEQGQYEDTFQRFNEQSADCYILYNDPDAITSCKMQAADHYGLSRKSEKELLQIRINWCNTQFGS